MNKNEQKLKELIIKWTNHFKHRKDFKEWRKKRIWQEKYQQETIGRLRELFGDLQNKKILDLGCGMGGVLIALKLEGVDVVGLETNHDYYEITKLRGQRYNIKPKVHEAPGENMPFSNDSFDIIVCKDVLEHCKNPQKLLGESHRTLKPGGQMYITVTNRFGFVDLHYHLRFVNWLPRKLGNFIAKKITLKDNSLFKDSQELLNMHYFTIKGFEKMVKKIGFSNYLNLTKKDTETKKLFFVQIPIPKTIFLNFYLSSWSYLLIK